MPDLSMFGAPDNPRGRWNRHPAIAVVVGESEFAASPSPKAAVEERVGGWILDEDPVLGAPDVVNGSVGRGAEGSIPVVAWVLEAAATGIIGAFAWTAVSSVVQRLRELGPEKPPVRFYVSRGAAAALAADAVAREFNEEGPLEIEAVEEPSGISGQLPHEISYVAIEPWLVLLSNVEHRRRYYVVVAPDGAILGTIRTSFLEWESLYRHPSPYGDEGEVV